MTSELVYNHLDFVHALNVFLNGCAGASTYTLRKGLHEAGAEDNAIPEKAVVGFLAGFEGRVIAVYEAGPTGMKLARVSARAEYRDARLRAGASSGPPRSTAA